jgi:hypothetical protein
MAKSRKVEILITAKDKATRVLRRITGSIKKWGKGAVKIAGGVVAGLGLVTGALTVMFGKLASAIDEQAKIASALGIANEALGAMRDAAGYAGISTEGLTTSLRKMSQGIGDAANGTGEAKDAIEALGLNAEKLAQMKPEEAFTAIIVELDKIPNGIKKTTLAMDLFGRSGAAMANLSAKGLQQAQRDADKLGIKLTTAQAAGVEAANDAWARIKIVAGDFLKYVTSILAPGINNGLTKAFDFLKKQDLKLWANKAALGITVAFQATVTVLGLVAEGVIAITRGLNAAVDVVNKLTRASMMLMLERAKEDLAGINKEIAEIENSEGWGWNERNEELAGLNERKETRETGIASTEGSLASASDIDAKADRIEKLLKEVQGFSSSAAIKEVMSGLESTIASLEGKHEDTKTAVEGSTKASIDGGKKAVAAENAKAFAADLTTAAYNRQFVAARKMNAEILKGSGGGSYSSVDAIDKALDKAETE